MSSGGDARRLPSQRRLGGLATVVGLAALLFACPFGAATAEDRAESGAPETSALPPETADLELTITGLREAHGTVYLAIYDRPEAFPKTDGMRIRLTAAVTGGPITITVPDLPPGRYAVAAFHDQNGNGTFDRGLFGVPLEGYGFTGNPSVFPVGPAFEDAAVAVAFPRTHAQVRMRYGL